MNLAITDYYRILKDSVRFSSPVNTPIVLDCLQLQTFRVLQRDPRTNSEVGTDTLGVIPTDSETPFFYSRSWELSGFPANQINYKYPLLSAFEIMNEADTGVFSAQVGRTYTLELAVLDTFQGDKSNASSVNCAGRPINQIYLDTERLLDTSLRYLGGIVTATTNVDPVEKVYFKPFLEAAQTAGDISSFDVRTYPGTILAGDNKNLRFVRVEYPAKNIYGTKVQLKIRVSNCPTIDFETSAISLDKVGFESGCKIC